MEIKYRLLYDRNGFPVGIAYTGYDDFVEINNDMTCFTYGRMNKTNTIKKSIEYLTSDDVKGFGLTDDYYFGPAQKTSISSNEDTVPDDIVYEQQRIFNHRKTA